MKVNVRGKDLYVGKDDIERLEKKLSFLDKYILIDEDTTAQVTVKKHGTDIKLEIQIPTKVGYLRSEVVDHEIRDAIDTSIDKLEDQIRKQKGRLSRKHREKLAVSFVNNDEALAENETVVRTKRVAVEDMDVEEAIMQMELLDHTFFVYKDADTGLTCVVYERVDGGYGVIEVI